MQAFTELRSMQFIQTRLRFITGFIVIIVTLSTGIVYTKFGTGILEVSHTQGKLQLSSSHCRTRDTLNLYRTGPSYSLSDARQLPARPFPISGHFHLWWGGQTFYSTRPLIARSIWPNPLNVCSRYFHASFYKDTVSVTSSLHHVSN